jgi:hypothetical protein
MGFIIRALFVISVLYLISPMRAALPDWLARPSAHGIELAAAAAPALAAATAKTVSQSNSTIETIGRAAVAACKGHEKACLDAAASALKGNDGTDPLLALLNETANDAAAVAKTRPVALADAVSDAPVIPLPPRRDTPPAAPSPGQKKI